MLSIHKARLATVIIALSASALSLVSASAQTTQEVEEDKVEAGLLPQPEAIGDWSPASAMRVKRIGGVSLSPSGLSVLYFTRTANIKDGHNRWDREIFLHQGRSSKAILQDCSSCSQLSWGADDQSIYSLATVDGERGVYRFSLVSGEKTRVSPPNVSIGWYSSAPDNKKIAVAYRDVDENSAFRGPWPGTSDPRPWQLLIADQDKPETYVRVLVDGSVGGFDWSPNGEFLVASINAGSGVDDWRLSELVRIDVRTGDWLPLTNTLSAEWSPYVSPDGRLLAHISTEGAASATLDERLVVRAVDTGDELYRFTVPDGRLSLHGWTADGTALVIDTIAGDRNEIGLVDVSTGSYLSLTPKTLHARGISLAGEEIAFIGQTPEEPPEVWRMAIKESPAQVTSVQPDVTIAVPRTESISWFAPDGLKIEGLLTYPVNWREGDPPAPLLVRLHGGPAFAAVKEFIGGNNFAAHPTAAFAAAGYAVFQPNYRGSAGRGFEFRSANVAEWGQADVSDVLSGVDTLINRGIADERRLGIMGWSYGGYLTAMTITTDKRFRAASIGAGISDIASWWGGTDFKYHVADYFGGSPTEKPNLYAKRSPALLVNRIGDTKILIQHGGKDQRVPPEQAQFLYRALKQQGKSVEFDLYPDMGHSAFDPATRLHILQRNFDWFTDDAMFGR